MREVACFEKGADGVDYNGPYQRFFADGRIETHGTYSHGKKQGHWSRWFVDGTVREIATYADDVLDESFASFHPTGMIESSGRYARGMRQGQWQYGYANGALASQMTFKDDKLDGVYTQWTPLGHLELQSDYSDGRRHGSYARWTGGCAEVLAKYSDPTDPSFGESFVSAKVDEGRCKQPLGDNQKLEEGQYCDDTACGVWRRWDPKTQRWVAKGL